MASIFDTTQELLKSPVAIEVPVENAIPEELFEEIFARLEEIEWEPSEEDILELQEKLTEGEDPEAKEADLSASSSDELFEEKREIIIPSFPVEVVVATILKECLSPGNKKSAYTTRYAYPSFLFHNIYH